MNYEDVTLLVPTNQITKNKLLLGLISLSIAS